MRAPSDYSVQQTTNCNVKKWPQCRKDWGHSLQLRCAVNTQAMRIILTPVREMEESRWESPWTTFRSRAIRSPLRTFELSWILNVPDWIKNLRIALWTWSVFYSNPYFTLTICVHENVHTNIYKDSLYLYERYIKLESYSVSKAELGPGSAHFTAARCKTNPWLNPQRH